MKYIKEYLWHDRIDELEDYLQEIFDEFHVVKKVKDEPYSLSELEDILFYTVKETTGVPSFQVIYIGYGADKISPVLDKIRSKKEHIEYRLNHEIYVGMCGNTDWGYVSLQKYF